LLIPPPVPLRVPVTLLLLSALPVVSPPSAFCFFGDGSASGVPDSSSGFGVADFLGLGFGDADFFGLGFGEGDDFFFGVGVGVALGVGLGVGFGVGFGVGVGVGFGVGVGVAVASGFGVGSVISLGGAGSLEIFSGVIFSGVGSGFGVSDASGGSSSLALFCFCASADGAPPSSHITSVGFFFSEKIPLRKSAATSTT
jgi:hypothetical protein